jgi:hypothetical protein
VKNKLLILILLSIVITGNAQLVNRPGIIESKIHTGMSLPFFDALKYLARDDIYALDLSIGFPTYGKDYWERLYNYPRTGVGFSYWSLGNNEVLGIAYALYNYLNIPILKRTEKFSLNYQISYGVAYLSKKFDLSENHLNRAIGSHANIYFRLGIDCKIRLFPRCEMVIEAGTTHFSNGKTRSPNYGINDGSVSLGFNYLLNENGITKQEPEIPKISKRYIQSVIYSAGAKVYDNLYGKTFFISSVSYNLERCLNQKRKIGLGADFFYDGSISEGLAIKEGTPENDFAKLIRFGLHTSYAIQYKKLIMGIQIGGYLYSRYYDTSNIYSRIFIQYMITSNIAGRIGIKSHLGKADFTEWGLGYCW